MRLDHELTPSLRYSGPSCLVLPMMWDLGKRMVVLKVSIVTPLQS